MCHGRHRLVRVQRGDTAPPWGHNPSGVAVVLVLAPRWQGCCPEGGKGRGRGWPSPAGTRQVPLTVFVFADPEGAVLPALVEEFREGDADRLMKPIKQ